MKYIHGVYGIGTSNPTFWVVSVKKTKGIRQMVAVLHEIPSCFDSSGDYLDVVKKLIATHKLSKKRLCTQDSISHAIYSLQMTDRLKQSS